ncbi:MAG: lipopolysaccharide biosynthesis protein [Burkholderiales bacterium]|nr:lipopolysaccharide biosynthesis protein [Burkholderiales bacterium]
MSGSVKRSLLFSFLDRYASLAINILSSLVIARLLKPSEIGTFSVAMIFTTLLSTMRDLGIGSYLIQEKELTQARLRSAWGVQLCMAFLCAGMLLLLSAPLARYFGEPLLQSLLSVIAVNFLVIPFGSLNYALLIRDMRFDAVAVIRLTQTLFVAGVSVGAAYTGHGALSLAYGNLAGVSVAAVAGIALRRNVPWLPSFSEVRRVLGVGTTLTASSLFSAASTSAPEFLLGKLQSMASVGFYSRANGLVSMVNRLLTDATYPVAEAKFAALNRSGESCAQAFVLAMAYLLAVGWPLCMFLSVMAEPLVLLMYGGQWADSINPTRILGLCVLLTLWTTVCQAALVATGQNRRVLRGNVLSAVLTVTCAAVASPFGVIPLCLSMVLVSLLAGIVWLKLAHASVNFDWAQLRRIIGMSALTTAAVGAAAAAGLGLCLWLELPRLAQLGIALFMATVAWSATLLTIKHPLGMALRSFVTARLSRTRQGTT